MLALGTKSVGSLSSLGLIELPEPEPGPGQVRVRVHAAAVNPADIKIVGGQWAARFIHARVSPLVPGYDLSGVVDRVGEGVTDLAVGDAVFGHLPYRRTTRQGTWAQWITIDAEQIAPKPEGVEHATAAAAATVGLTALQALRDVARLQAGSRLLVLGASGGVGCLAVGIGKRLGARVTGVCSGYAVDFVRELGAEAVIDRQTSDPLAPAEPFDVIFDTTGRYAYRACGRSLTRSGVFVTTMPSASFVLGKLSTMVGPRRCGVVMVASRRDDLQQLGRWIAQGMAVPVAQRVPVREAASALKRLAGGGLLGKIALEVIDGLDDGTGKGAVSPESGARTP